MRDRPALLDAAQAKPAQPSDSRWPLAFIGCAGVIGAAGVVTGAAGAHVGGGDLARTASDFMLVHAAVLLAGSGVGLALRRTSSLLVAALGLIAVGTVLFGGELASGALLGWRPVPLAAPTGGLCLIAGWLTLSGAAFALARARG